MQVAIKSVKIRKRLRKELGDITGLADSMAKYGQLHPIVITRRNVLVAGRRRLAAAQYLGWTAINAIVVQEKQPGDFLELEIDENLHRSQLSRDEIEQGITRLERLRNPGLLRSLFRLIAGFFRRLFGLDHT